MLSSALFPPLASCTGAPERCAQAGAGVGEALCKVHLAPRRQLLPGARWPQGLCAAGRGVPRRQGGRRSSGLVSGPLRTSGGRAVLMNRGALGDRSRIRTQTPVPASCGPLGGSLSLSPRTCRMEPFLPPEGAAP